MSSITRTAPIVMAATLAAAAGAPQQASAQEAPAEVANVDSSDKGSDAPHPAVARALAENAQAGANIRKTEDLDKSSKTQKISRRQVNKGAEERAAAAQATGTTATDDSALGVFVHNDTVRGGGLGNRYEVTYKVERDAQGNETKVPTGFTRRSDKDAAAREERYGKGLIREMGVLARAAQANGGKLSDAEMRTFLTLADRADGDTPSYARDQSMAARLAGLLGVDGDKGFVKVTRDGDKVTRLDVTHPPIEPPAVAMKSELPKTPLAKRLNDKHSRRPDSSGARAHIKESRDRGSQGGRRVNRTPGR